MADLDQLVGVLKAASEPTRLRILALLVEGELSVKDITSILGQSQPRVSRHLKLLADAALAARHAEGAWAYYGLDGESGNASLVRSLVHELDRGDETLSADKSRLQRLRQEQSEAAGTFFAEVAESWDSLRSLHVPESAIEARILEVVSKRGPLDRVLDLGTGTGRMLELLSGHYKQGLGVDSSREMIAIARAKLVEARIIHASVRLADITDPMGANVGADLVMLHQVLHYFDDPGRVISQAERALSAGGAVLVVDFAPHEFEFLRAEQAHRRLGISAQQMAGWAGHAGLKVTHNEEIPNPDSPDGLTVCLWLLEKKEGGQEERLQ